MSQSHKEAWYRFVQENIGETNFDPNRHDENILQTFIAMADSGQIELQEATGFGSSRGKGKGGGGGGAVPTYDPETEAKLDAWVQAKRARDFTTSDAIQLELEAQGVDTKAARPDPRKAGKGGNDSWGGGGGGGDMQAMMQ